MAVIQPLVLAQHTKDVSIFRNTRAIDVPDKLNAVAGSIKLYTNIEITAPVQKYINANMSAVSTYINDSMETIVSGQNKFTSDMAEDIGGYLDDSGAGYNTQQSRSLIETGSTGAVVFDDYERITSAVQGVLTTSNIIYDELDNITSFIETISIATSTLYAVSYDSDGNVTTSVTEQ